MGLEPRFSTDSTEFASDQLTAHQCMRGVRAQGPYLQLYKLDDNYSNERLKNKTGSITVEVAMVWKALYKSAPTPTWTWNWERYQT